MYPVNQYAKFVIKVSKINRKLLYCLLVAICFMNNVLRKMTMGKIIAGSVYSIAK